MNSYATQRDVKNYSFISLTRAAYSESIKLSTVSDILTNVLAELEDEYADDYGEREKLVLWWFQKVYPGIADNQREIIVCLNDDLPDDAPTSERLIGFSIMKKTRKENKFTLYVDSSYHHDDRVVRDLVSKSFDWFGDNSAALVYVPSNYIDDYPNIFTDDNWDIREKGPGLFNSDVLGGYLVRPRKRRQ